MITDFSTSARLLIAIACLAAGAGPLGAQQPTPDRFRAATPVAPLLAPPDSALEPRAPLARVAVGTGLGGALGGLVGGLAGAAMGSADTNDAGFISASEALGAIGFFIGYPLGAAIGARLGATVDGERPALPPIVMASAVSAIGGGLVWNRIGEAYEREVDGNSWVAGAIMGATTHWLATSIFAWKAPRVSPAPEPAPGDPGR